MKENPVAYASQPGLFLSAKSSNKAIAAAIFLDMHTSATPRHATYFCFILFQASVHKISKACFRSVYTEGKEKTCNSGNPPL
jgi:hypothetical protein